jgi:voltage-gated potassium channel
VAGMTRSGFKLESPWLLGLAMVGVALVTLLWSEGGLADPTTAWEIFTNLLITLGFTNILITLVREYPDKTRTILGQVFELLLLLSGTFIFGALIGKFSSLFVTQALLEEKKMRIFNNHLITILLSVIGTKKPRR